MKIYAVIEKYDNGEEYEDYKSYSRTTDLYASKEKAIKYIDEIDLYKWRRKQLNEREKQYPDGEVKYEISVTPLDNDEFVDCRCSDEEIIRTERIIITEYYNGKSYYDEKETYQYAIKEMEVIE